MADRQTTTKHLVLCRHLTLSHQRRSDIAFSIMSLSLQTPPCVSTFMRLITETWFEICIRHRDTSSSSMYYRPYGAMSGCSFPLLWSFSLVFLLFFMPACPRSNCPGKFPQVTTEQRHHLCWDYFIARTAAMTKNVWESSVWWHECNEIQPEWLKVEVRWVRSNLDAYFTRWRGGTMGGELHRSWTQSCRTAGGNHWRMHASKQMPVHILERVNVFVGMIAIAALEGTDGRGKWTPVPEDYCGAQDQSAAYIPLWASVTHYSTWSPSSTSPSWTSPPRHLSPRTDNSPSLPFPSLLLLSAVSLPACSSTTRLPKPRKQFDGCYMLLFRALKRQKDLEGMIQ